MGQIKISYRVLSYLSTTGRFQGRHTLQDATHQQFLPWIYLNSQLGLRIHAALVSHHPCTPRYYTYSQSRIRSHSGYTCNSYAEIAPRLERDSRRQSRLSSSRHDWRLRGSTDSVQASSRTSLVSLIGCILSRIPRSRSTNSIYGSCSFVAIKAAGQVGTRCRKLLSTFHYHFPVSVVDLKGRKRN